MKKLYTCAILMAASVAMSAQTQQKSIAGDVLVQPKAFTYGNNAYVISTNEDHKVSVYNDEIELVHSFELALTEYTTGQDHLMRQTIVKYVSEKLYNLTDPNTGDEWTGTWNQAREWVATTYAYQYGQEVIEKDNYQFWPANEFDYYGDDRQYPAYFLQWNAADGTISYMSGRPTNTYTGDWITEYSHREEYDDLVYVEYRDYDDNTHPDWGFYLTQTLFNDDEKFEYIEVIYDINEYISSEHDRDGDGLIDDRYIDYDRYVKGLRVLSEDGSVLQTLSIDAYRLEYVDIFKLNGKTYLAVSCRDKKYEVYETIFFKIDRSASSITRVASMPVSAKSFFSTSGQRRSAEQRGVNIVVGEDGRGAKYIRK